MAYRCIFDKPCDLATCHHKRHCLWTDEEIDRARALRKAKEDVARDVKEIFTELAKQK